MEEKIGSPRTSPAPLLGWLIAPLAVLLAIVAIKVVGIDFDLTLNNMMPMLVIAIAGILGTLPRILKNNDMVLFSPSTLSLATLGVAMIGHQAIVHLTDLGVFTALQFLIVTFAVYFFDSRSRHEWATVVIFSAIGLNIGMVASNFYNTELPLLFQLENGNFLSTLNQQRQSLGYIFFSYLMIFILLGLLVAVLARGIMSPESEEGWFGKIKSSNSNWNKSTLPLQIAILVWILAHVASLWHFDSVSVADKFGLTGAEGYHGHFGFWAAFFTGIVAILVAGMVSERWYTRAMLIGSMWSLYQVSSWYENGIWQASQLDGTWGSLIWLGFTFFICVGIYMISTHEKWGGWSNREDHEISGARKFWNAHWAGIMIGMAFFFGLVIRVQWYLVPSMNAYGTGNWDMTGGSDPWYMKRVVDYIVANEAHLIFDADRSYPLGGVNPRPPLFTWSIAIVTMLLQPMLGDDAIWYAMLGLPAIYGALTILPVAIIAKDHFGKSTGVVAAWLIAFMPAHVSHSTWALADHDAFVMLFISLGFMYWMKAVKYSGSDRLTRTSSPRPSHIFTAYGVVARERKTAMAYAILAGVSFGVASLGWKGFVVGPSILFIAYFVQIALNMFRRRDSTTINALFLTMLGVNLLMALPFYGHPQLDLVFDGTGLQPFLFVLGFSLVIAYVTTGFRDKPWLLVLGTLAVSALVFFTILWSLKQLEISNAWDVLFTGSGYFAKTKIFGTVAEANAPDRGQLFAQLSPIVLVLAISMGFYCLWSTLRSRNQSHLVFGIWIFTSTYMAWTAARFMFNATPAVAILGAWGITSLWRRANWSGLMKAWNKYGTRTPADRIAGARKAIWKTPSFSAILLIMVLLGGQQFTYGLDSAIPSSVDAEGEIDETIFNMIPDVLRWELAGFSVLDSSSYAGNSYLGSFGAGYGQQGWNTAYEWLANQDMNDSFSERPAFVSWWDYGFQALNAGAHPSVSDNFQSGIPASGNMLLARNQDDLISMFIWQLTQGDLSYSASKDDGYHMTNGFENIVENHLTADQAELFVSTQEELDYSKLEQMIEDYSFAVIQTNREVVMAEGHHRIDGIADTSTEYWRLYDGGERILCDDLVSTFCSGGDWSSFEDANLTFNNEVRSGQESSYGTTHYIFGNYWYTEDLKEELSSVSTHIHRTNTRLALAVQLLSDSLSSEEITNLYHDLIGLEDYYHVQDYNGLPGETVSRDHEIRYFAIDNRLYPKAGRYTQDYSYNQGQPMGIFGAPTILSGQDISTFMDETYETTRGGIPQEMTREQVDIAMTDDFLDQQAGLDVEPLQVEDVRVDHNPQFFDTMLARAYVGYGASSLGINTDSSNPQPAQHLTQSGTPGSYLQQALPLPGAMMNHFVIANWYSEDPNISLSTDGPNTLVKILKYYSGAEVSGQVTMSDNGESLPGVRLLIERDAFSGEGPEDLDDDTYWIPIGYTDADENGDWSFIAPAGKIRVSAFTGVLNLTTAQNSIKDGSFAQGLNDILVDVNEDRTVNALTAVLGNVANMTWLGEVQMNVTGEQADRIDLETESMDIKVSSSGISGLISWTGDESFNGQPLVDTDVVLRSTFGISNDVTLTTTNGSFTTTESRILQGTGEVTFTENGTFVSDGIASTIDFTGEFTRSIGDGRTFVANGTWNGTGVIKASWIDIESSLIVDCAVNSTDGIVTVPDNNTVCLKDSTGDLPIYMVDGEVNADGRFTSNGSTIITQDHVKSTFEGVGTFKGIGTFNGTGQFTGMGDFSGEMVNPGSFYQTGLVPGDYEVYAQLDNGREVKLPEVITVGLSPSYDLSISMPGSVLRGNVSDLTGANISNVSFDWTDLSIENSDAIVITTNSSGGYSFGPVSTGEYQYRIDIDEDGFYEVNETLNVGTESLVLQPISIIPEMYDVSIKLNSPLNTTTLEELFQTANRTIELILDSNSDTETYTVNESGYINAELVPGVYRIFDSNAEDYILFESFELIDSDDSIYANYSIATVMNGSLKVCTSIDLVDCESGDLENITSPASNVAISLLSGDLEFNLVSDINGEFTVTLPGDSNFQLIAKSTGNFGVSGYYELNNQTSLDIGILLLSELRTVEGELFVDEVNSTWNGFSYDNYVPVVIAQNEDGVEWKSPVTNNGLFGFSLEDGTYSFSVENDDLNATVISGHIVSSNQSTQNVTLMINPDAKTVTFDVLLDVAGNQSMSDGLPVFIDFTLKSLIDDTVMINVSSADYNSIGNVSLELLPGKYVLSVNSTMAESENATDFNSMHIPTQIYVDLDSDLNQNISIFFANEMLFNGILKDESGLGYSTEFSLYNEELNDWHEVVSDINGSFASYVPVGDWIVIVSPVTLNNSTSTLRTPLSVNSDSSVRTNLEFQLVEAMQINLQLLENLTESAIPNANIIAVSSDGFGNVTLSQSNSEGNVTDNLMPGNWSLFLEKSGSKKTWSLNSSDNLYSDSENNVLELGVQYADVMVQISGNVFWDYYLIDNVSQPAEWVSNASIYINGSNNTELNEVVTSDVDGNWRLFVPIRDIYNISVEKEGYISQYYTMDNDSGFVVHDSPVSQDIEIEAIDVLVSGVIKTSLINPDYHLDGASITLYPSVGLNREPISVLGTYDNGNLSWNQTIVPGDWIVVVESQNLDENGGGIAVGYLDASILDGGVLEMNMTTGGWVEVSTNWDDIELQPHHTGTSSDAISKIIGDGVEVSFNLGLGASWNYSVNADGEIRVLMPVGSVTLESQFTTIQHERGLEMPYSFVSTQNVEQGILDVTIDYSRKLNSLTSLSISTVSNATLTSVNKVTAIQFDEEYKTIEFELDSVYEGTETSDVFTVSGSLKSNQGSNGWSIEFFNGSSWVSSTDITMGIGESLLDSNVSNTSSTKVRILMPNVSSSWSFDDGQSITIQLNSDAGLSSTLDLNVIIPQTYGLSITEKVEETGVSPGGTGTFSFLLTNTGNGDDTFTIDLSNEIPSGWEITPNSYNITISKDESRSQSFTIFAPSDFTSGEIEAWVTIASEDGTTNSTVEVTIYSARISLSVDQTTVNDRSYQNEVGGGLLVIPVENSGFRSAGTVVVYANRTDNAGVTLEEFTPKTISVGAGQIVDAIFELNETSKTEHRYMINIDILGDDSEYVADGGDVDSFDFIVPTKLDIEKDSSVWLMVLIFGLTLLVGYGGLKVARNKASTRF